jgi:hypothetical protein
MRVNQDRYYEENPEFYIEGRWFKLPEYPPDVFVCPLCKLPETDGIYEFECDCWD